MYAAHTIGADDEHELVKPSVAAAIVQVCGSELVVACACNFNVHVDGWKDRCMCRYVLTAISSLLVLCV